MNNIKNLFLLECKLNYSDGKRIKKILSNVFTYVFTFILAFVVTAVICVSLQMVGDVFNIVGNLSFFIVVIQITLLIYSITNLQKLVLHNKDKAMLAYMPVSKWQIYSAKAIKCLIDLFVFSTVISVPVFIAFGYSFGLGIKYYLLALFSAFIMPILPFGVANLLLVPFMALSNFLRNKGVLKLIISIVLTIVLFYVYIKLVFNVANTLLLKTETTENILETLTDLTKNKYLASTWLAEFVVLSNFKTLLMIFVVSVLCFLSGALLSACTYKNIFNRALVEKNAAKVIKTKTQKRNAFKTYFVTEVKDIFRNSSHAYTYFGMAIAMPMLVYSCGKFMLSFAVERIGENIIFGTTLLVVLIFISIICSPTSAFISKEGESFWILKTNPRGIKFPLFAKSVVGIATAVSSLIFTLVLLVTTGLIKIVPAILILALSLVYIIGLVALGLILNLYKPNLFYSNKENNANMITHMLVGFVLSIGVGVLAIFISFKYSIFMVALFCAIIVVVFALLAVLILFTQYKKLYAKMEV